MKSMSVTSVKCKVKVDSYKAWSRFNGREYSFVRRWWNLTVNWRMARTHRARHHVSQAYYISSSHYFDVSCLFCQNRFKRFTHWYPGLVRLTMLSMWSLQPYGAAVPSCRIQCSSRFRLPYNGYILRLEIFAIWAQKRSILIFAFLIFAIPFNRKKWLIDNYFHTWSWFSSAVKILLKRLTIVIIVVIYGIISI